MRLVLYTGKGGVGKTTTAAATAVHAACCGQRTLLLSADPAHSLGDVLGIELGAAPASVAIPSAPQGDSALSGDTAGAREPGSRGAVPGSASADKPTEGKAGSLAAAEIDPLRELDEHWGEIRRYLSEVYRARGVDELLAEELAVLPGIEELAVLLAVERHARDRRYDFVVVDCAPTGSALRLTTLPEVLSRSLRLLPSLLRMLSALLGPLASRVASTPLPGSGVFRELESLVGGRSAALRRRLASPHTSVRIVATPERASLAEARRLYTELCLFGVSCDALVVNRLLPDALLGEPFYANAGGASVGALQAKALAEAHAHFAPLAVLEAPLAGDEVLGAEALCAHGAALFRGRTPEARLAPILELVVRELREGCELRLPLPGARADALEVAVVDDDLWISAGGRRRAIALPRDFARLSLSSARLDGGELVVEFRGPSPSPARDTPSPPT